MSQVMLGWIAAIVFGALDPGLMLPMCFPDKTTALLGAFASRFAIGFVIGFVRYRAGLSVCCLACSSASLTP
jgi:hypothetical protein